MESSFDVIVIGSATIDIFLSIHQTNKHFHLNEHTRELCVRWGDKALVDKLQLLLGGNASNVSVGLSRLGFKSAIMAQIGLDEFAQKIINGLKKEGVDESLLKKTEGMQSSLSIILNYGAERTIFCENVEMDHDFSFNNLEAKWIYLTSLGKKWEDAYGKTLKFAKEKNIKLAFNPGTSQLDAGYSKIREIIEYTQILFVNKEEALTILKSAGVQAEENIDTLLIDLKRLGPEAVIITDGINGSYSIDANSQILSYNVVESEAIERTGTGDSYSAGFLAAMLHKKNVKEAMAWGSCNAASVVAKVGAQNGLLTKDQMEEKLK